MVQPTGAQLAAFWTAGTALVLTGAAFYQDPTLTNAGTFFSALSAFVAIAQTTPVSTAVGATYGALTNAITGLNQNANVVRQNPVFNV
jgi:hypothetical protein